MYVCMYACMYVCMYVCMHVCVYVYIHTNMHTYIHVLLAIIQAYHEAVVDVVEEERRFHTLATLYAVNLLLLPDANLAALGLQHFKQILLLDALHRRGALGRRRRVKRRWRRRSWLRSGRDQPFGLWHRSPRPRRRRHQLVNYHFRAARARVNLQRAELALAFVVLHQLLEGFQHHHIAEVAWHNKLETLLERFAAAFAVLAPRQLGVHALALGAVLEHVQLAAYIVIDLLQPLAQHRRVQALARRQRRHKALRG